MKLQKSLTKSVQIEVTKNPEWTKIELPETGNAFDLVLRLNFDQRANLADSGYHLKFADTLCLYAAVSSSPKIDSKTRLVRLVDTGYDPNKSVITSSTSRGLFKMSWSVDENSQSERAIYVKYPLERNFAISLSRVIMDYNTYTSGYFMRYLDMETDACFNPTSLQRISSAYDSFASLSNFEQ